MKCPECGKRTEVYDSRPSGRTTWRRRRCANGHRFSTFEQISDEDARAAKLTDDELTAVRQLLNRALARAQATRR